MFVQWLLCLVWSMLAGWELACLLSASMCLNVATFFGSVFVAGGAHGWFLSGYSFNTVVDNSFVIEDIRVFSLVWIF